MCTVGPWSLLTDPQELHSLVSGVFLPREAGQGTAPSAGENEALTPVVITGADRLGHGVPP